MLCYGRLKCIKWEKATGIVGSFKIYFVKRQFPFLNTCAAWADVNINIFIVDANMQKVLRCIKTFSLKCVFNHHFNILQYVLQLQAVIVSSYFRNLANSDFYIEIGLILNVLDKLCYPLICHCFSTVCCCSIYVLFCKVL